MTVEQLVVILNRLYPASRWPKPFNLLQAAEQVRGGEEVGAAARSAGTTRSALSEFLAEPDKIVRLLGAHQPDEPVRRRTRQILGNLIVGRCAEMTFERIYKEHMRTTELELRDLREGRSDTDYRLFNGRGRPVYRVNIKFHGSVFRKAPDMVGLAPTDCFALATYKIHGALQKQHEDELPYIFVIVSVPDFTAESVGSSVPVDMLEFATVVHNAPAIPLKRNIEDRMVEHLQTENHASFTNALARIEGARWYVLGARRAANLMRELLFDRVYALRTRNFSRVFGGAEIDMHFSLANDTTPLDKYLDTLRDFGYPRTTTLLERGEY